MVFFSLPSSVIQEKLNHEEGDREEREERPNVQLRLQQGDYDRVRTDSHLLRGKEGEGGGTPSPEQRVRIREEVLKDRGEGREGVGMSI